MPELPEVERGRLVADLVCRYRVIEDVFVEDDAIVFDEDDARHVASALRGRTVMGVERRGKYLWLALDERPWPLVHFGMTGSFQAYAEPERRPSACRLELLMEGGMRLGFDDPRRFGRVRLRETPLESDPIAALGFDPLLDPPTPSEFAEALASRRTPIKSLLLDQSFAAGVGNWIADEALFQARIDPHRRANELDRTEARRLLQGLLRVVRHAVDVRASSARYPRTWLFHSRWGRPADARTPSGEPIAFDTIGGRTTAWVPELQH